MELLLTKGEDDDFTVRYEHETADIAMVFHDGDPMVISACSDRAKALFKEWGVDDDVSGIHPPENALDFISSVPSDWTITKVPPIEGPHLVQEIPLPQKISVVH